MTTAKDIIEYMESLHDEEQRQVLMGFFKTGKGEYGEGDEFLGIKVPLTREVVKAAKDTPLSEIPTLLMNHWPLYLKYAEQANNWDLVDMSAPKVIGHWLLLPTCLGGKTAGLHQEYKQQVLDTLAHSSCLWKQRISIVCTWKTSQQGDPSWCLRYAEMHLHHPHDLMHKAVGWMLREMGKRISMDLLRDFLEQHAHEMPRTALRYAIEKMAEGERKMWMRR